MLERDTIVSPEEAANEILRRRAAREGLIPFTEYTKPKYYADPFHHMVAEKLERVERGEIRRLMIFAPPRHGKSELSTRRFPAYFMARNPEKNVISASYNGDFAKTFGRDVRGIVNGKEFATLFPDVTIRSDNRSADEWELEQGGKYFAVGVGTGTTGKGAHCLTASSMVTTSIGDVSISELAHLHEFVHILGYDHATENFVWKSCPAFADRQADGIYRITTASGRVVEATAEHPFFANGRYVEAALLAAGDRLLLALPRGRTEDSFRVQESGSAQCESGVLLRPDMLVMAPECEEGNGCGSLQGMQRSLTGSIAKGIRSVLLSGVQAARAFKAGLVSSDGSTRQGSDHRNQDLRVLQSRVQANQQEAAGPVLFSRVQGQDACLRNDGRSQSRLEKRNESASSSAAFGESLSCDKAEDHREGQFHVRGLHIGEGSPCASHQHESIRQSIFESGDALQDMPHEMACCGAFEAVEDTVALVEFVCEPTTVYNITVDGTENFFANGVLTHNCFLIDDPIKDRKEADSPTVREDQWNWYRDVVYTRLEEDAAVVLTLTRWHHDDIAGRLLKLMDEGKGEPWDILTLPALPIFKKTEDGEPILLDDGTVPGDALQREPNEPLAPNRFSYKALIDRQEVLGDRSWSALYQQKPMSEDGGLFRSTWFHPVIESSQLPARRTRVRAWDLAASSDGDWTVGVLMSKDTEGVFYIENVIRFRGSPMEVEKRIFETAKNDGSSVQIVLPQDPGQAGKSQAQNFIRRLAGYRVRAVRPTGPKDTRAAAFAAQAEGSNVRLVRGSWNTPFLDELETFPLGSHDDQVDAASDAFNALLGRQKPQILDW